MAILGIGVEVGVENKCRIESGHHDRDPRRINHLLVDFGGMVRDMRRSCSPPARYASAVGNTTLEPANCPPYGTESTKPGAHARTMAVSSTKTAGHYATTGTSLLDARTKAHDISMNVLDAVNPHTVLRNAVSRRRRHPRTPLNAELWEESLRSSNLLSKYHQVPMFIRSGALAGIPNISHTFTPLNKASTEELSTAFQDIIQAEFSKGRYIGPFTRDELEREIGPFQSLPLSLVPKSGKPGKYCLIQNLSFPHSNLPTPSINSFLDSDAFPSTWGTFRTISTLIRGLPPGSQAVVRDIAEAYRIIPLHESQWPSVVVRIANDPERYVLNT